MACVHPPSGRSDDGDQCRSGLNAYLKTIGRVTTEKERPGILKIPGRSFQRDDCRQPAHSEQTG